MNYLNFNINFLNILTITFIFLIFWLIYKFSQNYEFFSLNLAQPNKVFNAEKDILDSRNMFKALPTKCFNCESETYKLGIDPLWSNKTKCFDCETQLSGKNPLKNLKKVQEQNTNGSYGFKLHL